MSGDPMNAMMELTPAQFEMLDDVPDELTVIGKRRGLVSVLGNQTLRVLKDRKLVIVELMPPRWQRTAAGRAALRARSREG